MGSFLDETLYPSNRCVLLRYEDFLFRFWDVMVHLSAFLPVNGQRLKEPPNSNRSKSHGHEVRGRDEALKFYSLHENRHCDFTPQHFARMRTINPQLLRALGYDSVPCNVACSHQSKPRTFCTWVPELRPDDIVAAHFRSQAGDDGGSSGRVWARVTGLIEGGEDATIEFLKEVPC